MKRMFLWLPDHWRQLRWLPLVVLLGALTLPIWGQGAHSITVGWLPLVQGSDVAVGFNVYRSTVTGGPYTKLNASPLAISAVSHIDTTGTGGVKYFYVIRAVDALGIESLNSTEVSGTFLGQPAAPQGVTILVQ